MYFPILHRSAIFLLLLSSIYLITLWREMQLGPSFCCGSVLPSHPKGDCYRPFLHYPVRTAILQHDGWEGHSETYSGQSVTDCKWLSDDRGPGPLHVRVWEGTEWDYWQSVTHSQKPVTGVKLWVLEEFMDKTKWGTSNLQMCNVKPVLPWETSCVVFPWPLAIMANAYLLPLFQRTVFKKYRVDLVRQCLSENPSSGRSIG